MKNVVKKVFWVAVLGLILALANQVFKTPVYSTQSNEVSYITPLERLLGTDKETEKETCVVKTVTTSNGEKKTVSNYILSDKTEWTEATVIRVIDGDTILVDISGISEKVRFSGINTPESVATDEYLEKTGKENTVYGEQASDFLKSILKEDDIVYLCRFTDEENSDKYGRLLRTVWTSIPKDMLDDQTQIDYCLNAKLLYEGYAECYFISTALCYKDDYARYQKSAEIGLRGLWADESFWEYEGQI